MTTEKDIIEELKKNIILREKEFQVLSDIDNYGAIGFARGELSGFHKALQSQRQKFIDVVNKVIDKETENLRQHFFKCMNTNKEISYFKTKRGLKKFKEKIKQELLNSLGDK